MKLALEYLWEEKWLDEDEEWFVTPTYTDNDIKYLGGEWIPRITHEAWWGNYDFSNHPKIRNWDKKKKKIPSREKRTHPVVAKIEEEKRKRSLDPSLVVPTWQDLVTAWVWKAFRKVMWGN